MIDFLLKNYSLLNHSLEFLAAITGIILYKRYRFTEAKYFIYFLVYIAVCSTLSSYTKFVHPDRWLGFLIGTPLEKNFWWSTCFWKIGAVLFLGFYYQKILTNSIFKKIIKFSNLLFFVFSITYVIFHWKAFFVQFFPIISVLGAVVVFISTIFYFIEVLSDDRILTFYRSLNFYISFVIFIWWLIITPIVFYDNYLDYVVGNMKRDWNFIFLRWQIYLFANIFMYFTYTFALVFCKPKKEVDKI